MSLSKLLKNNSLLSTSMFSKSHIIEFFNLCDKFNQNKKIYKKKTVSLLFYSPSTRTFSSFMLAAQQLNCNIIPIHTSNSSVQKGETFQDTVSTLAAISDLLIIRHPQKDIMSNIKCGIPIINAGDGTGEHPTQALLDIYTIFNKKNKIDGLNITFMGDIKHSRTIHSLINLLNLFNVNINIVCPNDLKDDTYKFNYYNELNECIDSTDVLYVTRPQIEFHENTKSSYVINRNSLINAKQDLIVMHPLPKTTEIAYDIEDDLRLIFYDQVKNGVIVRNVLLQLILDIKGTL